MEEGLLSMERILVLRARRNSRDSDPTLLLPGLPQLTKSFLLLIYLKQRVSAVQTINNRERTQARVFFSLDLFFSLSYWLPF